MRVAAVSVGPAGAAGPRQGRLEGGEHVVQAVADDDVVVDGNYQGDHDHRYANTWKRFGERS